MSTFLHVNIILQNVIFLSISPVLKVLYSLSVLKVLLIIAQINQSVQ